MYFKNQFALIVPIIFLLYLPFTVFAQEAPDQEESLYSNFLKEERQVKISFPKSYHSDSLEKYDVLYVLDGEWNTSLAQRLNSFLEYANFIPTNIIIVSIPNKYENDLNMRDRDFTPTHTDYMEISGGAGNFLLFLKEELVPFINDKYPVNTENNILYGTSLGGLFAVYAYLYAPRLFKSYLTVEPSLWWDNEYINKVALDKLENIKDSKNTLWISSRDGNAFREMGIATFDSLLTSKAPKNLHWKVTTYPNETHFSAIWKGIYDGMKFTFVKAYTDNTLINRANAPNQFRLENGKFVSFSKMDDFLKSQMDSIGIPGLSFSLINDQQIIYHRTLGVSNVENNQPVTDETIFDAASMTKTPFSLLVLRLVDKGILDLDKPLYTYLPNSDIGHDKRYKLITARMVLSHTTGFPNWRFFNEDGKLDIKFKPGTKYQYSGEAYEYLANVIAHLMNIKKNGIQDLFNSEIGKPMGMDNTYFTWNYRLKYNRASGYVDGKVSDGYGITAKNPNFYASHSMQTESIDYARLLLGIMNEEILKKETYDEMLKVQYPDASDSPNNQWGLGIGIRQTEFGDEFFHNGYNLNFSCDFMFNKAQKFGYVFFTNCNKGAELNKRLLKFFVECGE